MRPWPAQQYRFSTKAFMRALYVKRKPRGLSLNKVFVSIRHACAGQGPAARN
jgi:hypothetical protein